MGETTGSSAATSESLVGFTQPGILPTHRDILKVTAIPDVGAIAVAEFHGLVLARGNRDCDADTGALLKTVPGLHAVQSCTPTEPEIAVERGPKPGLHIVTQVSFEGTHGALRLGPGAGKERVAGKVVAISGEEPHAHVRIQHPIAPAFGIAKFRPEGPVVGAPVDEFRRVVLARRGNHLETHAQQYLLSPFPEILHRNCRTALDIHSYSKG